MGNFKRNVIILLFLFTGISCFAKQITLQIVQHNEVTDKISESSLVIEDRLMEGFFNNGFIVTNSEASVAASQNEDLILYNLGIGDAYEGCSDFFVQIKLYYVPSGDNRTINLVKADWTLASAITGNKIKESSITNKKGTSESEDLRNLSSSLVSEIKKAIKA